MNKKALVFAIMAVSLSAGTSAFAQDNSYRHDRNDRYERSDRDGRQGHDGRDERRNDSDRGDHRGDGRDGRWDNHGRNDYRPTYSTNHGYYNAPQHNYYRGGYVSNDYYRSSRYVVSDWRRYRLSAPPRGMQWVQVDNNYLLVALATGLIAQVVSQNY
jgi:Ni/Co efflux regulator RcnB